MIFTAANHSQSSTHISSLWDTIPSQKKHSISPQVTVTSHPSCTTGSKNIALGIVHKARRRKKPKIYKEKKLDIINDEISYLSLSGKHQDVRAVSSLTRFCAKKPCQIPPTHTHKFGPWNGRHRWQCSQNKNSSLAHYLHTISSPPLAAVSLGSRT